LIISSLVKVAFVSACEINWFNITKLTETFLIPNGSLLRLVELLKEFVVFFFLLVLLLCLSLIKVFQGVNRFVSICGVAKT